jgi:hypothetical protein
MNRKSMRFVAGSAAGLLGAIVFAAGTGVALADDHTPHWQHAQAHGHVYHRPAPPPRYHNDWHGYYRGYRPYYYSYAPPPVYYDPYPSPGVSLFFSF